MRNTILGHLLMQVVLTIAFCLLPTAVEAQNSPRSGAALPLDCVPARNNIFYKDGVGWYRCTSRGVWTPIPRSAVVPAITLEDSANKSTSTSLGNSDTLYPTQKAVKTYADSLVVGLLNDRGSYDASGNVFPSSGGSGTAGAIRKGDLWYISVAGTLGGTAAGVGYSVRALADSPGQTAGNWSILNVGLGYIPENSANRRTSFQATPDDTHYASEKLVKDSLDLKVPTSRTVNGHPLSSNVTVTPGDLSLVIGTDVEAFDSDLATIAGLSPSNDDVMQRKSGAWTNRTLAQLKTDLGATTVGGNLFTATNPNAISFPKVAADNTVSFRTPAQVLSDISDTSAKLRAGLTDENGTGAALFDGAVSPVFTTPTFVTGATTPLLVGGGGTTSTLSLQSTTGVGTTGADIIFKVGNNGGTEALRLTNAGNAVFPSLTSGSILFAGAGGALSQNNSVLTYNNTDKTFTFDTSAGAGTQTDLSSWNQSKFRLTGALGTPISDAYLMVIQPYSVISGSTVSYEHAGLLVQAKTRDPSSSGRDLDTVGIDTRAMIVDNNMTGRIWGFFASASIETGSDGLALAAQMGTANAGSDQPLVDTTTSKYVLDLYASGSGGVTAGLTFNASSGFHKMIWARPSSIFGTHANDAFIELEGAWWVKKTGSQSIVGGANNITLLTLKRNTDTAPTGNFADFQNAAGASLFTVNVAGHVTIEGVTSTGATGTGKFVFDSGPTLVNPTLGVATATRLGLGVAADSSAILVGSGIVNLSASSTLGITSNQTAIQLGGNGVIDSSAPRQSPGTLVLRQNNYFDGSNLKYISTGAASDYYQQDGTHNFRTIASGTAGTSATPTTVLQISATGITSLFKGGDVASAATITPTGNLFHVTGTTNITSVSGTGIAAGTTITIIFDGALTFTDGSNLKLAGNFVTTADDSISITYDGTNWIERSRSIN